MQWLQGKALSISSNRESSQMTRTPARSSSSTSSSSSGAHTPSRMRPQSLRYEWKPGEKRAGALTSAPGVRRGEVNTGGGCGADEERRSRFGRRGRPRPRLCRWSPVAGVASAKFGFGASQRVRPRTKLIWKFLREILNQDSGSIFPQYIYTGIDILRQCRE